MIAYPDMVLKYIFCLQTSRYAGRSNRFERYILECQEFCSFSIDTIYCQNITSNAMTRDTLFCPGYFRSKKLNLAGLLLARLVAVGRQAHNQSANHGARQEQQEADSAHEHAHPPWEGAQTQASPAPAVRACSVRVRLRRGPRR
jgi:hypothetical protein